MIADLDESIKEGEGVYKTDELWSTKGSDYFRIDWIIEEVL